MRKAIIRLGQCGFIGMGMTYAIVGGLALLGFDCLAWAANRRR